jgi:antirestriction protein ArdC
MEEINFQLNQSHIMITEALTKPHNPFTGTVYSGSNQENLNMASPCKEWATFLQWSKQGFKVKEGEQGTTIYFFREETRKNKKTGKTETVGGARKYIVFNLTQVTEKEKNDI